MEEPASETLHNDICRLCCERKSTLFPIFEKSFIDTLSFTLPLLKFSQNDGKPDHICPECCKTVTDFKSFIEKCIKIDDNFNKILLQAEEENQLDVILLESADYAELELNCNYPGKVYSVIKKQDLDEIKQTEISNQCNELILPKEIIKNDHANDAVMNFETVSQSSVLEEHVDIQDYETITNLEDVDSREILTESVKVSGRCEIDDIVQEVIVGYSENTETDTLIEEAQRLESEMSLEELKFEKSLDNKPLSDLSQSKQELPPVKKNRAPRMKGPFICSVCCKKYKSGWKLREHMIIHSGIRKYKCHYDKCDKAYFTKHDLNSHLNVHKKIHVCSYCNKSFPVPFHLLRHLQVHTGIKPVQCDICGKLLSTSHYLKLHTKAHYQASNGEFNCIICKLSFKDKWLLRYHCEKEHLKPIDVLKCKICDKVMLWKNDYKNHMKEHNVNDGITV